MKWDDVTKEGQTVLEEELASIRSVDTEYEGETLKAIYLLDKRKNKIVRIVGGDYGGSLRIFTEQVEKKKDENGDEVSF